MIKDELEKLHYQVIRPSLEQAKCQVGPMFRSCTPGTFDPFPALSAIFQEQMEMRKYELAHIVESIDCQSQGMTLDEMDTLIMNLNTGGPNNNPFKNYVRRADFGKEGYKVFDGSKWVELSEQATIHMDETFGQQIQVYAEDPATGYRLRIFDDPSTPGIEMAESTHGMFSDEMNSLHEGTFDNNAQEPENRFAYWEDPYYRTAKTGIGATGMIAGALEFRQVGELIPRIGLERNIGWYRNKEGIYRRLSAQRTGPGPGLHKVGARNALNRAKPFKAAGRTLFWVSASMSAYEVGHAIATEDSNLAGVTGKAALDVTMGIIGVWGGPIGWVISGTYFIGDALDLWGDWGKSAAQQQAEEEALKQQQQYNQYLMEMSHNQEFMIELEKTSRQELLENALQVRDNTELRMPRPIKEIMNN